MKAVNRVFSFCVFSFCIALLLAGAGCSLTNEIARTRHAIEANSDIDTDTGIVVSLGPGLFHTAGFLAKLADDEDAQMASRLAYGIRRIKAGVYPLDYHSGFSYVDVPELAQFKKRDWKVALKVEDYNEVGWIMYRERKRRVRDMFVVVLTEDELVLARLQGNLTELLDLALDEVERQEAGGFFEEWGEWNY